MFAQPALRLFLPANVTTARTAVLNRLLERMGRLPLQSGSQRISR